MFYIVEHEFIDLEADSDLWGVAWLMDQTVFGLLFLQRGSLYLSISQFCGRD